MAEPKLKEKDPPKSVSVDEFQEFQKNVFDSLKSLTTLISEKQATPEAAKETRAVAEAGPDDATVNPSWRKKAEEILGDALDEVAAIYPPDGGILFRVYIRKEHSNATPAYWEMHKRDVRTNQIDNTGITGVENWCKLIKTNLTKK